ncbi:MAG: hypothetical protein CVU06_11785, partial [Bacteroidetes bacterium HGW-Bacteroidetes-22]
MHLILVQQLVYRLAAITAKILSIISDGHCTTILPTMETRRIFGISHNQIVLYRSEMGINPGGSQPHFYSDGCKLTESLNNIYLHASFLAIFITFITTYPIVPQTISKAP